MSVLYIIDINLVVSLCTDYTPGGELVNWKWSHSWYIWRLFGSTTRVTRVSLTDMRNINNPALQAERFVLLSDKGNLFYQGHTGLRSHTVRCQ